MIAASEDLLRAVKSVVRMWVPAYMRVRVSAHDYLDGLATITVVLEGPRTDPQARVPKALKDPISWAEILRNARGRTLPGVRR